MWSWHVRDSNSWPLQKCINADKLIKFQFSSKIRKSWPFKFVNSGKMVISADYHALSRAKARLHTPYHTVAKVSQQYPVSTLLWQTFWPWLYKGWNWSNKKKSFLFPRLFGFVVSFAHNKSRIGKSSSLQIKPKEKQLDPARTDCGIFMRFMHGLFKGLRSAAEAAQTQHDLKCSIWEEEGKERGPGTNSRLNPAPRCKGRGMCIWRVLSFWDFGPLKLIYEGWFRGSDPPAISL